MTEPSKGNATNATDDQGSRTLRRGLQVLDAVLSGGREGMRVADLCKEVGLQRATVYRLLAELKAAGYVSQQGRFLYLPGPRMTGLSAAADTPRIALRLQPVLAAISSACGDAVFAIVREGAISHCIARQVGTHPIQALLIQVGNRQPLGVGAAGLAMLAALPDAEVNRAIAANEHTMGAYGGMTPDRMRLLVRSARERGWAVIGNYATRGVLAVGVPVLDAKNEPVAALSVATTLSRMTRDRQRELARLIHEVLKRHFPNGL
jgi:DNA-binding IclR family transcriptional regulator